LEQNPTIFLCISSDEQLNMVAKLVMSVFVPTAQVPEILYDDSSSRSTYLLLRKYGSVITDESLYLSPLNTYAACYMHIYGQ
jgi:hypothetical protein